MTRLSSMVILCVALLVSACASAPLKPSQNIAKYAGQVIQTTNQVARTAAGLSDAGVLSTDEAASIIVVCDRLDRLAGDLVSALLAWDLAPVTDRPGKAATVVKILGDMRAALATIHAPAQATQLIGTLTGLANTFLQIEVALGVSSAG